MVNPLFETQRTTFARPQSRRYGRTLGLRGPVAQTRTVPSWLDARYREPSRLNASALQKSPHFCSGPTGLPVAASQRWTRPPLLDVRSHLPSRLTPPYAACRGCFSAWTTLPSVSPRTTTSFVCPFTSTRSDPGIKRAWEIRNGSGILRTGFVTPPAHRYKFLSLKLSTARPSGLNRGRRSLLN